MGPLRDWVKQIKRAAEIMDSEKKQVKSIVDPAIPGIKAGYHLLQSVDWNTPADDVMILSILNHIKLDKAKKIMNSIEHAHGERVGIAGRDEGGMHSKQVDGLGMLSINEIDIIVAGLLAKKHSKAVLVEVNMLKSHVKDKSGTPGLFKPMKAVIADTQENQRATLSTLHVKLVEHVRSLVEKDLAERRANKMTDDMCKRALEFVTPRDKRTLIEMVMNGLEKDRAARLLLGRTKTLLEREFRRQELDTQIAKCSENGVPFTESIVRAQKAFMTIELDCIRKFSYNAFMEYGDLRSNLGKLLIVSQIQCRSLDDARVKLLMDIRDNCPAKVAPNDMVIGTEYFVETAYQKYESIKYDGNNVGTNKKIFRGPPQDTLVIGGGVSLICPVGFSL